MSSLTTGTKHVVIDTGDGDKQQENSSGGRSTTVGLSDVGMHKTHTEEQGAQTTSAVKPATTVVAAVAAETTDSAAPTKSHHQQQHQEQLCLGAAEHARSGGEKGDNTPPAGGGHDQVCDAEGEEQMPEEKTGKTYVTKESAEVGTVAAVGSGGFMPVIDPAVDGGHGDIDKPQTDGDHQKKHMKRDGPSKGRLNKEHNKKGEGEWTGEQSDDSKDLDRTPETELDDGARDEQQTTEGENGHKNVVGKEQEFAVKEEETEREETEEEESEEEEEEEEDAESLAKTDEDNRCNLEAAIDSLQLLLVR